uniref:Uncharacterized protein n=1 Tax=Caenorhabditis japonica TaxID=281687 RepID=A0A8R1I4U0_CAEJA
MRDSSITQQFCFVAVLFRGSSRDNYRIATHIFQNRYPFDSLRDISKPDISKPRHLETGHFETGHLETGHLRNRTSRNRDISKPR